MKNCVFSPIKFSAPHLPAHPWPYSPLLELPAGDLQNHECGRVLTGQQFILAVGLSPQHYSVVERAPGIGRIQSVLDQAIGFLIGRGAEVIPVQARVPVKWFVNAQGAFEWQRCVLYFVRSFLATDPTDPPWIPPAIWPTAPLSMIADAGRRHWRKVEQILRGVGAADPDLLLDLGTSLTTTAKRWELYLARMIFLHQRAEQFDANDRNAVADCDRLFYHLIGRFEPAYEFLADTIARLL